MSHASESAEGRTSIARRRAYSTNAAEGAILAIATTLGLPYTGQEDLPVIVSAVQQVVADQASHTDGVRWPGVHPGLDSRPVAEFLGTPDTPDLPDLTPTREPPGHCEQCCSNANAG